MLQKSVQVNQKILATPIVQCIDYIGYSTRTLCAVCEECSVFAIHYKYIVEGLRKTIRRTKIIDLSF